MSTWVSLSTFARWQHSYVHYYLLGSDTAVPSGLYTRLWRLKLQYSNNADIQLVIVELRCDPAEWYVDVLTSFTRRCRLDDSHTDERETQTRLARQTAH